MKSYVQWLTVVTLLGVAAAYEPVKDMLTKTNSDKQVSFQVFKASNYKSEVYDSTFVNVHITITKRKKHEVTQIWDTTFTNALLKKFPEQGKAVVQTVNIPNVSNKEHVEVKYILTYDTKGNTLQLQGNAEVNESKLEFDIPI